MKIKVKFEFLRSFLVATKRLYMRVRPSVRWSVTSYFFGLLGATNAVYTALFKQKSGEKTMRKTGQM